MLARYRKSIMFGLGFGLGFAATSAAVRSVRSNVHAPLAHNRVEAHGELDRDPLPPMDPKIEIKIDVSNTGLIPIPIPMRVDAHWTSKGQRVQNIASVLPTNNMWVATSELENVTHGKRLGCRVELSCLTIRPSSYDESTKIEWYKDALKVLYDADLVLHVSAESKWIPSLFHAKRQFRL